MQINAAHWHLLLNHFPIILSIIATGFLFLSLFIKNSGFRNASLLMLVAAAVFAGPAYRTGEGAEDAVEGMANASEMYLEKHEDIASAALTSVIIAGIIALLTMAVIKWKNKWAITMLAITCIASATSAGFLGYTGFTGGKITHSEIRNDSSVPNQPGQKKAKEQNAEDDD
ncbi:MAG: DUF2231 domain-containing protein [Chitinophagales bacterium]